LLLLLLLLLLLSHHLKNGRPASAGTYLEWYTEIVIATASTNEK